MVYGRLVPVLLVMCHVPGGYNSRSPINQSRVKNTKNAKPMSINQLAEGSPVSKSDTQRSPESESEIQYWRSSRAESRVQGQEHDTRNVDASQGFDSLLPQNFWLQWELFYSIVL